MGKTYAGVNGTAKAISKIYAGVDGTAKVISKVYAGDENGIARLVYGGGESSDKLYFIKDGDTLIDFWNINSVSITDYSGYKRIYRNSDKVGRLKFQESIDFNNYTKIGIEFEKPNQKSGMIKFELFSSSGTSTSGRTDLDFLYNDSITVARNTVKIPVSQTVTKYFALYVYSKNGMEFYIYNLWLE